MDVPKLVVLIKQFFEENYQYDFTVFLEKGFYHFTSKSISVVKDIPLQKHCLEIKNEFPDFKFIVSFLGEEGIKKKLKEDAIKII